MFRQVLVARAAVALLSIPLAGCIAIPFVVPPAQVQVGGALRTIEPPPKAASTTSQLAFQKAPHTDAAFQLRADFAPMQVSESWLRRDFDVSLGYTFDSGKAGPLHGASFGGGYFPWKSASPGAFGRASVAGRARLLVDPESGTVGNGFALQFAIEFVTFARSAFGSASQSNGKLGGTVGAAYGEGAIGLVLEPSYVHIGGAAIYAVGLGLQFRIPTSAGFVLASVL